MGRINRMPRQAGDPAGGTRGLGRRLFLAGGMLGGAAYGLAARAHAAGSPAADGRITMLTNWFAQAEHGGFYQAAATGLYAKAGLDVTIQPGGPQINNQQLLASGAAEFIIGHDEGTLIGVERGLPTMVVATTFQFDPTAIMTHDDVTGLAGLKGRRVLVPNAVLPTVWATLQRRYGLTADQVGPYNFNMQPFFLDRNVAIHCYVTSEPFEAKRAGVPFHLFLLHDAGVPGYGNPIATTHAFAQSSPQVVTAFLKATMEGWRDYLADPKPGNALIMRANPRMDADRIAFSVAQIKALGLVTGGDAATRGIGIITEARWKQDDAFLLDLKMLDPATDWHRGFDTQFIDAIRVMPA